MKIVYATSKIKNLCTNQKMALKFFGGDKKLVLSLFSRINAIKAAGVIKDIVLMPNFHFHSLHGDLEGFFSIDVKTRRDKWRLVLRLLDKDENVFHDCSIDKIANIVEIVEIKEVSPHYE